MSNVTVNKVGMDIVDIEVRQHDKGTTDMFFQNPVLDYTRDYVMGVSELSVPLNAEPMLSAGAENQALFAIRNRGNFDSRGPHVNGPADWTFAPGDITSFGSFYAKLVDFVLQWQGNYGNPTNVSLRVRVLAEGRVVFLGDPAFWTDHWIEMTSYGMELLGTGTRYLHFTQPTNADPITQSAAGLTVGGLSANGNIQGNFHMQSDNFQGGIHSLEWVTPGSGLHKLEHRLRIEVDADLSVPANILMENEQQKVHYNIASFAFPSEVIQRLTTNGRVTFESDMKAGQFIVKKKSTPTTDWSRLLATANVQNMRLHVFIVRREFNEHTQSWTLVRNELRINEGDHWDLTLKFVQTF